MGALRGNVQCYCLAPSWRLPSIKREWHRNMRTSAGSCNPGTRRRRLDEVASLMTPWAAVHPRYDGWHSVTPRAQPSLARHHGHLPPYLAQQCPLVLRGGAAFCARLRRLGERSANQCESRRLHVVNQRPLATYPGRSLSVGNLDKYTLFASAYKSA
jgi:hypothetical protein